MQPASRAIIGLYERHAGAWDDARPRTLFERPWLDRFCALVAPGAPVLDLGCGAGDPIARYLADQGHPVTGVDTSPTLVGRAAERLPRHTWMVRDMRGLDLGSTFGGIVAWDSFFHLTASDQRSMFPVFRAHAAPGAALMFTSGPAEGEAIGSFQGEPLYHASLSPEAYRLLLAETGFDVVRHVPEDETCGGRTVWLAVRPSD